MFSGKLREGALFETKGEDMKTVIWNLTRNVAMSLADVPPPLPLFFPLPYLLVTSRLKLQVSKQHVVNKALQPIQSSPYLIIVRRPALSPLC